MATYVCSDIHGMYAEFLYLLDVINFTSGDKMYVLGDVVDRGPNGLQLLKFIMDSENIEMIVGNHELLMLDFYRGDKECENWFDHVWFTCGGSITLKEMTMIDEEEKELILDYIESLPYYLVVDNYLLVHGGFKLYSCVPSVPREYKLDAVLNMDVNTKETVVWDRTFIKSEDKIAGYTTIVGHTPTITLGSENMIFKDGKILIDCGCVYGGKLGCLRLDDMKEIYI